MLPAVTDNLPPLPNTRPLVVFWLAVILAVVLLARTVWLASRARPQSQRYTEELLVPGLRGSIFSSSGQCLAKSIRQLGVFWYLPKDLETAGKSLQRFASVPELAPLLPTLEELPVFLGQRLQLCEEESMQLLQLMSSLGEEEELRLEGFFIRRVSCPEHLRERLGTVAVDPETHLEVGLTGWEAQYDRQLRGAVQVLRRRPAGQRLLWHNIGFFPSSFNGRDVIVSSD